MGNLVANAPANQLWANHAEAEPDFTDAANIPNVPEFDAILAHASNCDSNQNWSLQQQKLDLAASLVAEVQQQTENQQLVNETLESMLSTYAPRPSRGVNSSTAATMRTHITNMVGLGLQSRSPAVLSPSPPLLQHEEPAPTQSHPSSNPLGIPICEDNSHDVIQQWAIALAAACDPNPDNYITEEDARQLKQVKEQREKHETNQEFGWIQNQREPNPDRRPASRPFQSTAVKSFPADHQGGHMSTTVGSKRPRSPRSSTIGSTAERTGADGAVLHISNLEISKGEDMWAWHNESPHVPTSRAPAGNDNPFSFVDSTEHRLGGNPTAVEGQAEDLANLLANLQQQQPWIHPRPDQQYPTEVAKEDITQTAIRLLSSCDGPLLMDEGIQETQRLQNYHFSEFVPGVKARRGRPQTNREHRSSG